MQKGLNALLVFLIVLSSAALHKEYHGMTMELAVLTPSLRTGTILKKTNYPGPKLSQGFLQWFKSTSDQVAMLQNPLWC